MVVSEIVWNYTSSPRSFCFSNQFRCSRI